MLITQYTTFNMSDDWGEELHNAHGITMWNAVAKIAKDMGFKNIENE